MKISLNHIRAFKDEYQWSDDPAPQGIAALVQKIGSQLAAVEEVIELGPRYEGVIIAKVVSCVDHPDSDHLHLCKIDDGGRAQNVDRDENGHVQVVCGASNVREGLTVAWLPPGSTVPESYEKDPFVLEARSLRGQVSNGMLASARELALGDNHEGILEIDEARQPGELFAEAYGLKDDYVIDMENKMFTHRPDCFGMIGLAREIAGIQGQAFKSPEWYQLDPKLPEPDATTLPLEVRNELPALVPRFVAAPMSNVTIKPSPVWLQVALTRLGVRPINNVVDITNYYMLVTGQPLHAYDYDKVKAASEADHPVLVVRHPRESEKIALLNGKEITPRAEAIMIATDKALIGVGGVMGGADTEVDEHTTNVIFECASFDMYSIRRTSMAHGLFTDAVTRFNKGQSPLQNLAVILRAMEEATRLAGATLAGPVIDDNHVDEAVKDRGSLHEPVFVTTSFINERLGWDLSADDMRTMLTNVEFDVAVHADELTVTAPFWRSDIELPEDVVEEIGRLYGYDHLSLVLPRRDLTPAPRDGMITLKNDLRRTLAMAGANELLTYSFVHGNLLERVGQNKIQAFQLSNALSPDLQYFRLSLGPSLLDRVQPNLKAGYSEFALFEINKVHPFGAAQYDEEDLPKEADHVALVFAADEKAAARYSGAPYYQARMYLVHMLADFRVMSNIQFEPLKGFTAPDDSALEQLLAPYEPARSALVRDHNGLVLGIVGEYRAAVRRNLKLPAFCAGFELDLSLFEIEPATSSYIQLPRFPKVEQDICLKVASAMSYAELFQFVWDHLHEHRPDATYHTLSPVDIFQRQDDPDHKQITLRLSLASYERTLTADEVNLLLDRVAAAAHEKFAAERI